MEFSDVSEDRWSKGVINTAASLGIINGVGEQRFAPTSSITRQDAAIMIYRVLEYKNISITDASATHAFSDESEIASYATEAVKALVSYKIINGFEDGSFRPMGKLTRAEMSKIIYTILNIKH